MKIFLTGGAGFIGSHLATRLIRDQYSVLILDNFSTGNVSNLEDLTRFSKIEIYEGSILDEDLVIRLMKQTDGCIHLGAALGVKRILERPYESFKTNTQGTENVVKAASVLKKRLFLASTSEIYGKNRYQPLSELSDRVLGSPQLTRWAYSEAKAMDETLAQMFSQSHGLEYVVGRFFNTVGPRQSGMYGMVLPRFVSAAIQSAPIQVYGDGSQSRTFCHVEDAIDAIVRLFFAENTMGHAFNIGGESEISIRDLATKIIHITQSNSEIEYVPYSSAYPVGFEEIMRRVPDTTKLRTFTAWSPKRNLDKIIEDIKVHLQKS